MSFCRILLVYEYCNVISWAIACYQPLVCSGSVWSTKFERVLVSPKFWKNIYKKTESRQFPIVCWKESTYSFSNWKSLTFLKNKTRQKKTKNKTDFTRTQMQMSNLQLIYSLQILWSVKFNAKTKKKKMDSSFKGKLSWREVGEDIEMNWLFLLGIFFSFGLCFLGHAFLRRSILTFRQASHWALSRHAYIAWLLN